MMDRYDGMVSNPFRTKNNSFGAQDIYPAPPPGYGRDAYQEYRENMRGAYRLPVIEKMEDKEATVSVKKDGEEVKCTRSHADDDHTDRIMLFILIILVCFVLHAVTTVVCKLSKIIALLKNR